MARNVSPHIPTDIAKQLPLYGIWREGLQGGVSYWDTDVNGQIIFAVNKSVILAHLTLHINGSYAIHRLARLGDDGHPVFEDTEK